MASLLARFPRRYSMKITRLRRLKRSNLWKMQNLVPSSSSAAPAHPFTTRALGDEEVGTDIGRGGHKMSTGWEEQGSGGDG